MKFSLFHRVKLKVLGRNLVPKALVFCAVVYFVFLCIKTRQETLSSRHIRRALYKITGEGVRFQSLSQHFDNTFLLRSKVLQSGCKIITENSPRNSPPVDTRNVQLFTKKRLGLNYCKVPKAGSTFWMNFFLILNGIYRETDIYRKARYEIHETADNRLEEQNSLGSINDKDVTVMIVRDPYQRLFSAYMDKIFIPLYIEDAKAIASLRNRKCYRENSFQDFLDYVTRDDDVTLNEGQDVHWSPIYYICLPCNIPYNVIIKSEHFSSEVGGLLKSLNLTSSEYELFSKMLNSQNIEVSVQVKVREILRLMLYYDFKNKTCMTYIETMERVWTSFKAQGYMCDEVPFPPVFRNMYYFKIEETIQIILDAIRSCHMPSSQRIKQRMDYLSKAYRAVSYNTTSAIRRYFAPDFLLFNYSQVPPI